MRNLKQLEEAALEAHRRGESWLSFWPSVAADVNYHEPHSIARHRRLAGRLLSLVVSGDCPKQIEGDALPWEADDTGTKPSDCTTNARYQGSLPLVWQG